MFFHLKCKFIFTLINVFLLFYSLQACEKIEEDIYYKIKNPETEKVLSIYDAHRRGNKVIAEIDKEIYPSHKIFKLTFQKNNIYCITNLESQKVLSVYQTHTGEDEIIAEVDDGTYLSHKLFEFISQGNNLFYIKNLVSYKVLSLSDADVKGSPVIVEDENYNPEQYKNYRLFKLEKDIDINNFLEKIRRSSSFPEQSYSFNCAKTRNAGQTNVWRDPKTGQQILLEQNTEKTLFLEPHEFSGSK